MYSLTSFETILGHVGVMLFVGVSLWPIDPAHIRLERGRLRLVGYRVSVNELNKLQGGYWTGTQILISVEIVNGVRSLDSVV